MEFKTLERVPIVSTGTYPLGSGETTFTAEDLAAAVLASNDPTVPAPRIKLGHVDKRFEADESLDAEPAFGTLRNLTLSDDGQTVVADLADVPAWLADSMASAFPGRSIEGGFGFRAPSGHHYKFAIDKLALLGTKWPGVTSLADLQDVLSKNGPVETGLEASSQRFVSASLGHVAAALDVGGIPRVFAADLSAGKVPKLDAASRAWPRSIEAADDGALTILVDAAGKLLRLPIKVAGDALEYGDPAPVVAASGTITDLHGPRVLASWPSTSAVEPERKVMKLDVDQTKLAAALGLAEDADEAAINAKLGLEADGDGDGSDDGTATGENGDEGTGDGEGSGEGAEARVPVAASSGSLPKGVVAIDADRLAKLEADAAAGAEVAKTLTERKRDETITAAIKGGRIVAKSRPEWEKRFETAPDEAERLLTASVENGGLAAVIPVDQVEAGIAGDGDRTSQAPETRLFTELQEA